MLVIMLQVFVLGLGIEYYQKNEGFAIKTCPHFKHPCTNNLSTSKRRIIGKMTVFQYIVDNVMLSNYHTLRYIASTLDSTLRGFRIAEIFSQNRDELVVMFDGSGESLVVSCRADANTCYLHRRMARAKANSANVLPRALGGSVESVSLHPSDRVITIALTSGYALVLQFFGSRSNVLLIDRDLVIVDAFQRAKQLAGTRYEIISGDLIYDIAQFQNDLRSSPSAKIAPVMKKAFPSLGATLVHEILYRSSIPPGAPAGDVDDAGLTSIQQNLRGVLEEVCRPSPRIILDRNGNPSTFSIIPLRKEGEATVQTFDDIHSAVRTFLSRSRAGAALDASVGAIRSSVRQQVEKTRRTCRAMEKDARESERADEYEKAGAALMANLQAVRRGASTVTLENGGDLTTVTLDPSLTPVQNAQRYFSRAKRSRQAASETGARLGSLRSRLSRGEELLALLDVVDSREEWDAFQIAHADRLDEFGISEKRAARAQAPFRIFSVDGGFEVWAGKSSENNDLLTLRHAKPDDLWFHARGSGGSHVVLKIRTGKGEPSKKAKQQAAGIAAYYSKMKNASMVPVAMTERKYVRKPKGAPAGTVVLEREKVIFAEPALPEGEPQ
jgi:predicted ribosome quality control (RQC) complex YloA/Tae2 family protein